MQTHRCRTDQESTSYFSLKRFFSDHREKNKIFFRTLANTAIKPANFINRSVKSVLIIARPNNHSISAWRICLPRQCPGPRNFAIDARSEWPAGPFPGKWPPPGQCCLIYISPTNLITLLLLPIIPHDKPLSATVGTTN